jgi:hypothetical protein
VNDHRRAVTGFDWTTERDYDVGVVQRITRQAFRDTCGYVKAIFSKASDDGRRDSGVRLHAK